MINKIQLITTTSSIDGWKIEKYYGLVTYQLVVGANIFHDVFASFRDIFGGSIKGYQRDLEGMELVAIENLKKKALKLGANIIIGVRLDFDEVSGGGKSMFMLSASGTAAFGRPETKENIVEHDLLISSEELLYEIERDKMKENVLSDKYSITYSMEIQKLIDYKIEAIEKIVKFMYVYVAQYDESKELILEYFSSRPVEEINSFLKSKSFLSLNINTLVKLLSILEHINWFDYDIIFYLLKLDDQFAHQKALYLINLEKKFYSGDDIEKFDQIIELLKTVYSQYPIMQTSKTAFGKTKDEWRCIVCDTNNSKETKECSNINCHANVFGIPKSTIDPEKLIQKYLQKKNKLKQFLNI